MHLKWFLVSWLFDFSKLKPLSLPALCPGIPLACCCRPALAPVLPVWPSLTPVETCAGQKGARSDFSGFTHRCFSSLSFPYFTSSHLIHFLFLFIYSLKKHLLEYLPIKGEPSKLRENILTNTMQAADRGHKLDVRGLSSACRCVLFVYHNLSAFVFFYVVDSSWKLNCFP